MLDEKNNIFSIIICINKHKNMSILKVANYYQVKLAMNAKANYRYAILAHNAAKELCSKVKSSVSPADETGGSDDIIAFRNKCNTLLNSLAIFTNTLFTQGMSATIMKDRLDARGRGIKSQLNDLSIMAYSSPNFKNYMKHVEAITAALGQVVPMDMGPQSESAAARDAANEAAKLKAYRSRVPTTNDKTESVNLEEDTVGPSDDFRKEQSLSEKVQRVESLTGTGNTGAGESATDAGESGGPEWVEGYPSAPSGYRWKPSEI
jgi:hypothetical protein